MRWRQRLSILTSSGSSRDRLGRCLQRLGLERKPRDVTPSLQELPAGKGGAMSEEIPKKRQRAEQLRKKRAQAASARAAAAKTPPKAIPIAQRRSRPSGGASA